MVRSIAVVAAVFIAASTAHAQRGVQTTPRGETRLVSKDVGGERWAIALNQDDGTITGNVYRSEGGPPQYVWCLPLEMEGDPIRLRCRGTTGCDAWTDLGEVALPASFLAPEPSCSAAAERSAITSSGGSSPGALLGSPAQDGEGGAGSGLRLAPDRRRILLNKDIDGLRWAMVYDPPAGEDRVGTLHGNVFDPAGGDPRFVSCEVVDPRPRNLTFACSGADACRCGPCQSTWTPIGEVTLPRSFLEERRCSAGGPPAFVDAVLRPSLAVESLGFGASVAVAGDTAAVGVPDDAVYIYERSDGAWAEVVRLPAADPENDRYFAQRVAAGDGTVVASDENHVHVYERGDGSFSKRTRLDSAGALGIRAVAASGDTVVFIANVRGDAVLQVFERSGESWRDAGRFPGDPERVGMQSVAVAGDTIAVGYPSSPGGVQLYERREAGWIQAALLEGSASDEGLGAAVAISGDTLLVGAPPEPGYPSGQWIGTGTAVVFERSDGVWQRAAELRSCAADVKRFGTTLAVSGGLAVVGSSELSDGGVAGTLAAFRRSESGWSQVATLSLAESAAHAGGVALDGTTLVTGVPGEGVSYVVDLNREDLGPPAQCTVEKGRTWPGEEWNVERPGDHGMNLRILDRARQYAFQPGKNTQGVVVVRHGVIVAEWYEDGRDSESFAASWSTAKSVAGGLIGIAIDRGDLAGVDVSMADFFPEWAGTANAAMRLRDVLAMSSGLSWFEDYSTSPQTLSDVARLASTERDQLAYVVAKPVTGTPGRFFSYSSGDTMLLSGVIEAAVGKTMGDYAREVLFDPIGMERAEWWTDAVGHTLAYCCLDAPTRDFARFGLLYARDGRWGERQVVPADWVRTSTQFSLADSEYYGFQWWLDWLGEPRDLFMGRGFDGQFIYVIPSLDLVVVRNGHYEKDPGPPIADPNLFARYPAAGLGNGRGTVPPDVWNHGEFLGAILESIVDEY